MTRRTQGSPVTRVCGDGRVDLAYYDWQASGRQAAAEREQRDAQLLPEIKAIRREYPDYGSPGAGAAWPAGQHRGVHTTMALRGSWRAVIVAVGT